MRRTRLWHLPTSCFVGGFHVIAMMAQPPPDHGGYHAASFTDGSIDTAA
jgi:hypothetical protein